MSWWKTLIDVAVEVWRKSREKEPTRLSPKEADPLLKELDRIKPFPPYGKNKGGTRG